MPSNPKPLILLSNDDGIEAEGLRTLADALAGPGVDLLIVAPHEERSATGHAISVLRDLRLEECDRDGRPWGWSFEGSPADCVKMAVQVLARDRKVDLMVSGMNRGQNLGVNVLYSGTVAAAREAVIQGVPGLAISIVYRKDQVVRFDTGARVARELVPHFLAQGMPPDVLLNVNVPPIGFDEITGYSITRQGDSGFRDKFEQIEGKPAEAGLYRNVGDRFHKSSADHLDLDDVAVYRGRVSITPLHIDATAHHHRDSFEDLKLL